MGLLARGCVNHPLPKSGCWACAVVAENDHQRDQARAAQYRRNEQIAKQRRRQNRSAAAGAGFSLGVGVTERIVEDRRRKIADLQAKLDSAPKPEAPTGWQPDPLDDNLLRWWDGSSWQRQTQVRPIQPSYPAGWYPDYAVPGQLRYFDGNRWTHHVHGPGT